MKHFLTALLSFVTISTFAQIDVDSNGNVGIGTDTPSMNLDIFGGGSNHNNILNIGPNDWFTFGNLSGAGCINWFAKSNANISGNDFINTHPTHKASSIRAGDGFLSFHTSPSNTGINQSAGFLERMRVTSAGRVGIGTTDPNHKLDIALPYANFSTYNYGSEIVAIASGGWARSFRIRHESNNSSIAFGGHNGNAYISTNFDPTVDATGYLSQKLTIRTDGNVGVGTAHPKEKLHVEGDLLVHAFGAGNESGIFFRENFTDSNKYNMSILAYDHNGASSDGLSINGFDGVSFSTGANTRNERVRIDQDGNVGIGITAPTSPLHVKSDVNKTLSLDFVAPAIINTYTWQSLQTSSVEQWRVVGRSEDNANLEFWNKTADPILSLMQSGNVGIGTTDTFGHKLAVDGKATFKNEVLASEFKVYTFGANTIGITATPWPDYVFESDYDLLSLEEVEDHISQKGHLPNVPSAKEVEAEGSFSLGEMNKKLLEKVEELTLYLIEQNKEIKQLKQQMKSLQEQVKTKKN
jgi:hypothetical protein